jgi:prophage regulatory protein
MTENLDRFVRLRQLPALIGLSARSIAYQRASGNFPKPRNLTGSSIVWLESEVQQWMQSRPVAAPDGRGWRGRKRPDADKPGEVRT